MPPKPRRRDLSRLSDEQKDLLIEALFARLEAVEAKLGLNSENSSKRRQATGWPNRTRRVRYVENPIKR